MPIDPGTLALISGGLEGIGGYLGSGAERAATKRRNMVAKTAAGGLPQLEKRMLLGGITPAMIAKMVPMLTRTAMPGVNRILGRGSARFGSGSGAAKSAGINELARSLGPAFGNLWQMMLASNQADVRDVYRGRSQRSIA